MAEEGRTVVAKKRGAQKQDIVYGIILFALAAAAIVSAAVNADRGTGFVAVGAVAAAVAALFGAYCTVRFVAQKKLPEVLVYAEGGGLFCYQYKSKRYERVALADILFAEGGASPADVRAGILRIKTAEKTVEVAEAAETFAACEKILRLKADAANVRGEQA